MKIIIVGGGIAGLATAIALEKHGIEPVIYEAAPEIKPVGAGIALSVNAYKALKALGLEEAILQKGNFYQAGELKTHSGKTLSRASLEKISEVYGGKAATFSRPVLHEILLSALTKTSFITGKQCSGFDRVANKITVQFSDGSSAGTDYLIAADGIHSVIRKKLIPTSVERYSGQTCWRGICHHIPKNLDMKTVIESWGPGIRFGIVPVSTGSIYWFAVKDEKAPVAGTKKTDQEDLIRMFGNFHSPVKEIIEKTDPGSILWNDLYDFVPIKRFNFGNILLIGDAAHATTPNLGQGGCMALEDAAELDSLLARNDNIEEVFSQFQAKRIPRTTKIVNASYRLGKVAHITNPFLVKLRNIAMRAIPDKPQNSFYDFLFGVEFS